VLTNKKERQVKKLELDDRKVIILKAIIQNYMETGEPVGSRTISKLPDLKISSATIRNEMSDLEDMGYIVQPHTSAGRIPSDRGYRFYVDNILNEKQLELDEFKDLMLQKVDRLELVLKQMAKVIATNTNYAALISAPSYQTGILKFIQLSKIDEYKLLLVIVLEGNIINNKIIDIDKNLSDKEIFNLNLLLNTSLNGLSVADMNINIITKLQKDALELRDVVDKILQEISNSFSSDEELNIYTSGTTNIFKYPELSQSDKAKWLIDTFEEKAKLKEIFDEVKDLESDSDGIQVHIGEELPIQTMKDCSVVTANYELGEGLRGTIGIVGPKRMDYEKVLKTIRTLMLKLDEQFKQDKT
jgi:heat-inducible transcription repressor hrcA